MTQNMKDNLRATFVVIVTVSIIGWIGFSIGYSRGLKPQDPLKTRVSDIIEEMAKQGEGLYDKGVAAGERIGFDEGYRVCWNSLGMNWLGSYDRFREFSAEYGNLHNTPWEKFTLNQKVTIAMYGGSGSKLSQKETEEFISLYSESEFITPAFGANMDFILPKKLTTDPIGDFINENYKVLLDNSIEIKGKK